MKTDNQPLKILSLFSGIGGLDLAVKNYLYSKVVSYCEIDDFCQKVLKQRMEDGLLDLAPIHDDVNTIEKVDADMIIAGFPCQPFSHAGLRKGETDERNQWINTIRIIRMVRPQYILLENVPGLLSGDSEGRQPYVYTILRNLAEEGFDAEWDIVGADDAGAPHKRKRWFCFAYRKLANSNSIGHIHRKSEINPDQGRVNALHDTPQSCDKLANSDSIGYGGRSSQRCGTEQRSLQQNKQEGSEVGSQIERCCGNEELANPTTPAEFQIAGKHTGKQEFRTDSKELAHTSSQRQERIHGDKRSAERITAGSIGGMVEGCMANPVSQRLQRRWQNNKGGQRETGKNIQFDQDAIWSQSGWHSGELAQSTRQIPAFPPRPTDTQGWQELLGKMPTVEPSFCRVSDGWQMVNRMDRLKALGNSVSPNAAMIALDRLINRMEEQYED